MNRTSPLFAAFVLGVLGFVHGTLVIDTLLQKSLTSDEIAHLPAGLTYLEKGTFRMLPHAPLPRLLSAVAARTLHPDLGLAYDSTFWKSDPPFFWQFAFRFMMESTRTPDAADRYLALFTRGRLVIAVISILTLPLLFWWGRWWFGCDAGYLAAALWAFCPTVLAHAGLVTADLAYASFGLLATLLFARFLQRPGPLRALVAGLALGLAEVCKHSGLWLFPILGLWGLFALWRRRPSPRRLPTLAGLVALLLSACLLAMNAVYRFEGTGRRLGDYVFISKAFTRPAPDGGRVSRFRDGILARVPVPLPFYYVAGIDALKVEDEVGYQTYLNGETRRSGFPSYFLWALLLKLPLGTLLLLGLASLQAVVPRKPDAESGSRGNRVTGFPEPIDRLVPIVLLTVVPVLVLSFLTNANIGVRYLLPTFPFLFLWAGTTARPGKPLAWSLLVVAALVWNASAVARVHPNELAYFNELAGGPRNGRFHLIDSNLDWGQDLGTFARWLEHNPDWKSDVRIAYAGNLSPEVEGIEPYRLAPRDLRVIPEARRLPWERLDDPRSWGPQPGKFAVSVNLERGFFFRSPIPRELLTQVVQTRPGAVLPGTHLLSSPKDAFAYFQRLTPRLEPEIGYSILLYDVSLEDANRVRRELGMPLLPPG